MKDTDKSVSNKQINEKSAKKKKLSVALLFFIIVIIPASVYFTLFMNSNEPPNYIKGKWDRTDGNYTIEIKEIMKDGVMDAAYFNPDVINVGRAAWKSNEGLIQVYVELRDKNYPGSYYNLVYDKELDILKGDYYQAVSRQTFNVEFTRQK